MAPIAKRWVPLRAFSVPWSPAATQARQGEPCGWTLQPRECLGDYQVSLGHPGGWAEELWRPEVTS